MTDILFTMASQWTASNSEELNQDGFIVLLTAGYARTGEDQAVLELENRNYLGRLSAKETGEAQIACANIRTGSIQRGECLIVTEGQFDSAMERLLNWMGEDVESSGTGMKFACPEGKRTYSTKREAKDVMKRSVLPNSVEAYRCRYCHQWHLSTDRGMAVRRRTAQK